MAFLEEYTLLDELGQGGYATVYKVRHNNLGYIRAIRVLNAFIAHGETDPTYQKFLEECKLLLRLGNGNHPNIVHIYQPLLKAQRAIVEMDFVDGKDLYHYLQDKHAFVEIKDVLRLLSDIGSALAYCHEDIYKFCMDKDEDNLEDDPNDGRKVLLDNKTKQRLINKYRVIHNDIHSGNIIRREDGSYVLLDFGLAIEGDSVVRSSRRKNGAPEFKAPEKWDNDSILTTQSDIYSFGVVLYEYLAGRVPFLFDKKNPNSVEAEYLLGKAHKEQQPASIFELRKAAFECSHPGKIYEKDYPEWLEILIMKCLSKSIKDRFKNGKELYSFVIEHINNETDTRIEGLNQEIVALQNKIISLERSHKIKNLECRLNEAEVELQNASNKLFNLTKEYKALQEENTKLQNNTNHSKGQVWKILSIVFLLTTCIASFMYLSSDTSNTSSSTIAVPVGDHNLYMSTDGLDIKTANKIIAERDSLQHIVNVLKSKNDNNGNDNHIINQYRLEIEEKEVKISALNKEISALQNELWYNTQDSAVVGTKDKTIRSLNSEISKLRDQIREKDRLINALNEQMGIN